MGKYLHLGTGPGGDRWTLPEKTDVAKLRKQLAAAMKESKAVTVTVEVGGQTAELVVNSGAIPAALAWEDAPSGGGITIID